MKVTLFSKEVFDDSNEDKFTHKVTIGDFNVAINHTNDTLGYLHVNNPNSRDYLTRKIDLFTWWTYGDWKTLAEDSILSAKNRHKIT